MGRDSLGRTTNMSSKSFTNVHLTAYPSFSYFPSELRPSMSASRTRELTGDVEDAAVWDAAGVKERDQRTTPPAPPGWPSVPDCERSWGRKMRTLVRDGAVVEHGEEQRTGRPGAGFLLWLSVTENLHASGHPSLRTWRPRSTTLSKIASGSASESASGQALPWPSAQLAEMYRSDVYRHMLPPCFAFRPRFPVYIGLPAASAILVPPASPALQVPHSTTALLRPFPSDSL